MPGGRSGTLYCPVESVIAERVFSIRTGLDASTLTPGSTPPDVSLTTPESVAWAKAEAGIITSHANATIARVEPRMFSPSLDEPHRLRFSDADRTLEVYLMLESP